MRNICRLNIIYINREITMRKKIAINDRKNCNSDKYKFLNICDF